MEIRGKVALITGASEGIGAAVANALRQRGARLSLVARSADKLAAVGGPEAAITAGDLREPETRRRAVQTTIDRFGAIDILINNAGVGLYAPAWKAPMEEARALFELNVMVPLEMVQLVVPLMQPRGSGMIVNVGSIAGKVTLPWFTLYSASKYALGSMTDGLRMELRSMGIHAMTVCPGYVDTDFQRHVLAGKPPETVQRSRMFKITPQHCAEAIARGIERDARTIVTPRAGWVLIALARLMPWLVDRQLERMYLRGLRS